MQAVLHLLFCTGRGVHLGSNVTLLVLRELQRKGPSCIKFYEPQHTVRTKGTMDHNNAAMLHRHIAIGRV